MTLLLATRENGQKFEIYRCFVADSGFRDAVIELKLMAEISQLFTLI